MPKITRRRVIMANVLLLYSKEPRLPREQPRINASIPEMQGGAGDQVLHCSTPGASRPAAGILMTMNAMSTKPCATARIAVTDRRSVDRSWAPRFAKQSARLFDSPFFRGL